MYVKTVLVTLLFTFLVVPAISQPVADEEGDVGIGTNVPDPSAVLDLVSTSGGLLIPRMTSAERDAIENPATGLMIFNTETGQFEYNAGVPGEPVWSAIGGGNNWRVAGNIGTNPASDFLGTLDDQPVVFRTNDIERMRLTTNGLMPGGDDVYDLGSFLNRWRDLYLGPGSLHIVSNNTESDWSLSIEEGESSFFAHLLFNHNGTPHMALSPSGTLRVPSLGSTGTGGGQQGGFFNQLVLAAPNGELFGGEPGDIIDDFAWVLNGNAGTNSSTNFLGTTDNQALAVRTNNVGRLLVTTDGNTLPGADNTYDLGSSTVRWQDIHLGPGSLHIHSTAAETGNARDWSVGIIGSGTGQGSLQIAEGGSGTVTVSSQGDVGVGAADPTVRVDVDGGLAVRPPATVNVTTTTTTTITVGNRSYIRVDSDGGPNNRPVTLSDGLQDGQILALHCIADCDPQNEVSDGIDVQSTNAVFNNDDFSVIMYRNSTLTLIWDDTQSIWVELSRTFLDCDFIEDQDG